MKMIIQLKINSNQSSKLNSKLIKNNKNINQKKQLKNQASLGLNKHNFNNNQIKIKVQILTLKKIITNLKNNNYNKTFLNNLTKKPPQMEKI